MAQIINTNVPSLLAQRSLSKTTDAMSTSIQRLSSGYRINSAQDDAAGMAIVTLMTSQILGLNKAAQNANDAISLAQIAEGGMGTATDILQQMRTLAVQSANGTNSSADRQALQDQVSQLINEIDDVANNTQFNGQSILNGAFSSTSFQIGANANETTSFSIASISSSDIGKLASLTGGEVSTNAATDIYVGLAGTPGTTSIASSANFATTVAGQDSTSAYAKAAALNAANIAGFSAQASTSGTSGTIAFAGSTTLAYELVINDVSIFNGADGNLTATTLAEAINVASSQTGVVATLDSTAAMITLTAADGRDITVTETNDTPLTATGSSFESGTALKGDINITANSNVFLTGTTTDIGFTILESTILTDNVGINTLDITTQDGAQEAIQRIDSALSSITSNRSAMGAMENRFDATIANLQNISDNSEAARSRIQDTDYAAEMANLTKNQILQQAGTAMLSQANSLPQSVLSLLR